MECGRVFLEFDLEVLTVLEIEILHDFPWWSVIARWRYVRRLIKSDANRTGIARIAAEELSRGQEESWTLDAQDAIVTVRRAASTGKYHLRVVITANICAKRKAIADDIRAAISQRVSYLVPGLDRKQFQVWLRLVHASADHGHPD